MSGATIIRFQNDRRPDARSGRFSTREVYRAETWGEHSDPASSAKGSRLRVLARDRHGVAGLKSEYACRLAKGSIARIRLTARTRRDYRIDWVYVPPAFRGRGIAGRLLRQVTADADAAAIRLSLEARACGGPDQLQLESWYRSFGFVPTGWRGVFGPVLARAPRSGVRLQRCA